MIGAKAGDFGALKALKCCPPPPKFSNYSFKKKSIITIFNVINTQLFIKILPFKVLKECPEALVNISLLLFHTYVATYLDCV